MRPRLCTLCRPSSAFNNILSNLGYILLGLLFLLIILQREINHNRALLRNDLYALVRSACPPTEASAADVAQPCPHTHSTYIPLLFHDLLVWFPSVFPCHLTSPFSFFLFLPNRNVGSPNTSACSMPWAQP